MENSGNTVLGTRTSGLSRWARGAPARPPLSAIWKRLEEVAKEGGRTGDCVETKRLLLELQQINEDYLALALPRIEEWLVPMGKRDVRQ